MATNKVISEIARERQRQIENEGYRQEHDDEHTDGSIADAAAWYAANAVPIFQAGAVVIAGESVMKMLPVWPWEHEYDKKSKHDRRRQLVIAAALLVAEIERLDRIPS